MLDGDTEGAGHMDAVRVVFGHVLHRRLARECNVTVAVWSGTEHWGLCGQSCPCCRFAAGDVFGSCDACDAAAQSLRAACTIASFIREEQSKREVVAALTGSFGPRGRPLPQTVMIDIGDMLPEIRGIVAPARLAGVALLAGGMPCG